jgi:hypothetical protein
MTFANPAAGKLVFLDANTLLYHFTAHAAYGPPGSPLHAIRKAFGSPGGASEGSPGRVCEPGGVSPEGRRRVAPGESPSPGTEEASCRVLAPEGRRKPALVLAPPPLRGSKRYSTSPESPGSRTRPGLPSVAPPGSHPRARRLARGYLPTPLRGSIPRARKLARGYPPTSLTPR